MMTQIIKIMGRHEQKLDVISNNQAKIHKKIKDLQKEVKSLAPAQQTTKCYSQLLEIFKSLPLTTLDELQELMRCLHEEDLRKDLVSAFYL